MQYLWKIGGEAGFGIMTTGVSLSMIASRSGFKVFNSNEYPSLIRGGHNTVEVLISNEEVGASKVDVDLLVCLNSETYQAHKHRLNDKSTVIYDADDFQLNDDHINKVHVPFKQLKKDMKAAQVMVNTIALGASMAVMGGDIQLFYDIIAFEFKRKGDEVVEFNNKLAAVGYDYVKENYPQFIHKILIKQAKVEENMVLTGNDAFSLASVVADCRLYVAYPMTPSSTVLSTLAKWQNDTKMVVRHAEDEISVINTALGSSFAGVRSAVGTSGGGFALMVESVSFAGIAEIPIVIFMSQRPGPATGMPTWTEQGDLLFSCFSGHGEFPKVVLAPGDLQEMFELGLKSYDLADVYQLPVIVLSDKFLSESYSSIPKKQVDAMFNGYKPNRGKLIKNTKDGEYLRYKVAKDGISERLIPGAKGFYYQANSYEHLENSHTTESDMERQVQADKRMKKMDQYFERDFALPKVYGDLDKAEIVFVSWGGMKGIVLEAQRLLKEEGKETAFVHFTHVYPLHEKKVNDMFDKFGSKKLVLVENNATGQFGQLLRMQTGINIEEKLLKYNGRPFFPVEIVSKIK